MKATYHQRKTPETVVPDVLPWYKGVIQGGRSVNCNWMSYPEDAPIHLVVDNAAGDKVTVHMDEWEAMALISALKESLLKCAEAKK